MFPETNITAPPLAASEAVTKLSAWLKTDRSGFCEAYAEPTVQGLKVHMLLPLHTSNVAREMKRRIDAVVPASRRHEEWVDGGQPVGRFTQPASCHVCHVQFITNEEELGGFVAALQRPGMGQML